MVKVNVPTKKYMERLKKIALVKKGNLMVSTLLFWHPGFLPESEI